MSVCVWVCVCECVCVCVCVCVCRARALPAALDAPAGAAEANYIARQLHLEGLRHADGGEPFDHLPSLWRIELFRLARETPDPLCALHRRGLPRGSVVRVARCSQKLHQAWAPSHQRRRDHIKL